MPKDTHRTITTDLGELELPEQVTVAVAELAGAAREGLLALAVGTGLQVMQAMLEEDVARLVGPKGRHNPARAAVRHGSEPGQVTLGGRRVRCVGPGSVPLMAPASCRCRPTRRSPRPSCLASWPWSGCWPSCPPAATRPAWNRSASASSTPATGTSKSAVSRRFVARTEHALAELLAQDLSTLDLVALHGRRGPLRRATAVWLPWVSRIDGTKIPLALAEGATENAAVVRDLLVGLRDRGLDTTRPLLIVIDGAKALRRAVTAVFDHPVIQRCQLHKIRNVTDRLPDAVASAVAKRMRRAYHHADPLVAQAELEALARELDRSHPGAAASLREGLAETLTIGRLGVPPTLARTLRSTNTIESMIEICRDHAANVKRWQDGQMVLRWTAAGMGEAAKQFRRVNGYLHLPALRVALDQTVAVSHRPRRMPPDQALTAAEVPR